MEKSVNSTYSSFNPLVLAYMGDAYYETLVRRYLIGNGDCRISDLNQIAKKYVTAVSQSKAVDAVLPHLCEEELAVFKAGRNAKSAHSSKAASIGDYRRATGLESLFGWLYISGEIKRADELFSIIVESIIERE